VAAEIWALCDECERWFYCAGWFDKTSPAPTCPVCGGEPTAIVNRAASVTIDPSVATAGA